MVFFFLLFCNKMVCRISYTLLFCCCWKSFGVSHNSFYPNFLTMVRCTLLVPTTFGERSADFFCIEMWQVNLYVGVGLLSLGYAFRLGGWICLVRILCSKPFNLITLIFFHNCIMICKGLGFEGSP